MDRHGVSQNLKGAHLKVIIAVAALCLAPFTAMAADLGLRKTYLPGADTPATPASPWTGAYAGVNAGGGFGTVKDPTVTPVTGDIKTGGVLGGLQVGYNHQVGSFVLGVEVDYALAHLKGDVSASVNHFIFGGGDWSGAAKAESRLESFGTVRARAGVAMNSALLFATGGWAYGRNKIMTSGTLTDAVSGESLGFTNPDPKWMSGWTLGAGVEYAFMQNVTAKLEYLYADLGKSTFSSGAFGSTPVSNKVSIIRAGVNYRY